MTEKKRVQYEVEVRYGEKWHSHGYPQDDADAAFRILSEIVRGTADVRVRKIITLFERISGEQTNG